MDGHLHVNRLLLVLLYHFGQIGKISLLEDGMVFNGQQAVAPVILRKTTLQSIHDGHSGIAKCIERAKQSVYRPGYVN